MTSFQLVSAVVIAAVGWIATVVIIKRSRLSHRNQKVLMLSTWLPWIALALGAPALNGVLSLSGALGIGGALTAGIMVPTLLGMIMPPR